MARLAAFDMDGTLLMPDHQLGETTQMALHRLHQRGVTLAFATGRHLLEMRQMLQKIALEAFLITGNGTRIHAPSGELLFAEDLSPQVAEAVLHGHWNTPASLHVFNDSGWLTDTDDLALLEAHAWSGFRYQLTDLKRLPAHQVTKICFVADHDALCKLRVQLCEALGSQAHICFSALDCLEVLPPGCNKGAALQALSLHLGITMADCMAFGDAMNDREMLSLAGKGLIMGNAMPQLIAELPHLPVIGHCSKQAVAHYLTHWLDNPHQEYSPE
ncbi:HMP-PP phosphatase [Cronobacter turicensis]